MSIGSAIDDVTTPMANSSTLKLTSGILAMTESYQQTSSGTLAVNFAGTSPGTGFGQLDVSNPVTLAGTLDVSTSGGFTPPHGVRYGVLLYAGRSGSFTTLAGGPRYRVVYTWAPRGRSSPRHGERNATPVAGRRPGECRVGSPG